MNMMKTKENYSISKVPVPQIVLRGPPLSSESNKCRQPLRGSHWRQAREAERALRQKRQRWPLRGEPRTRPLSRAPSPEELTSYPKKCFKNSDVYYLNGVHKAPPVRPRPHCRRPPRGSTVRGSCTRSWSRSLLWSQTTPLAPSE